MAKFEDAAEKMIAALDETRNQIAACNESLAVVEQMKLSITPDAATLISQGDTLVFEAHGKSQVLTKRLMTIQATLRDKFKDVQHTRPLFLNAFDKEPRDQNPENQNVPKEKVLADKKFPKDMLGLSTTDLEDLTEKVCRRIAELVVKPVNWESEAELHYRLVEIKVSF